MRVLTTIIHFIDIQRINNHHINGILIITLTGIMITKLEKIIIITHQYMHLFNKKNIYSLAQLEPYRVLMDEKALNIEVNSVSSYIETM